MTLLPQSRWSLCIAGCLIIAFLIANTSTHQFRDGPYQQQRPDYAKPYQQEYPPKYRDEYEQQNQQQQHWQKEPPRNTRYGGTKLQQQQLQQQQQQHQGNRLPNSDSTFQQPGQYTKKKLRQQMNGPHITLVDRVKNKCTIWVPIEAFDKYPNASKLQVDQTNQQQMIEICCKGYAPMLWGGNTLCRPLCDNCQNGICIAPGQCQCYDEFVSNDNGDCVFACPLGCLNGRCYLDGSCQCEPGYKLDETRRYCRPICSAGCGLNPRHNCTEPEVCSCAKGYQLMDGNPSDGCQPTCQPDCGVGGKCVEKDVCECAPGYILKDNVCQKDCYQKCENGICYDRHRCICNPGFTYHERSTQCIPA